MRVLQKGKCGIIYFVPLIELDTKKRLWPEVAEELQKEQIMRTASQVKSQFYQLCQRRAEKNSTYLKLKNQSGTNKFHAMLCFLFYILC